MGNGDFKISLRRHTQKEASLILCYITKILRKEDNNRLSWIKNCIYLHLNKYYA